METSLISTIFAQANIATAKNIIKEPELEILKQRFLTDTHV